VGETANVPMDEREFHDRLADISTHWTLLEKAHGKSQGAAQAAWQELTRRYLGAVYRYLLAAVRDVDAAQELAQEFALRFVSGRFRAATPERGRFRSYLKTCLFHLVDDFQLRRGREPLPLAADADLAEPTVAGDDRDQCFLESWRSELLARCWRRLEDEQAHNGQPYFAVMRLRVDHPEAKSAALAELLAARLGRPVTAAATRQILHRARQRFAELLYDETSDSLGTTSREQVEEELGELNLLKYCKPIWRHPAE
jgi:DNA-directed RNA polymerase specialized sigma24 family protein